MTSMKRLSAVLLAITAIFLVDVAARGGDAKDPLQAKSVWRGEIRQDAEVFPTIIFIHQRDKDRIKGEIQFTSDGELHKLTFEGNVLEGGKVAWITDKKEGSVTFPGLYIGTIKGKTLSGVWQVPSAGQYDTFSVKLAD